METDSVFVVLTVSFIAAEMVCLFLFLVPVNILPELM